MYSIRRAIAGTMGSLILVSIVGCFDGNPTNATPTAPPATPSASLVELKQPARENESTAERPSADEIDADVIDAGEKDAGEKDEGEKDAGESGTGVTDPLQMLPVANSSLEARSSPEGLPLRETTEPILQIEVRGANSTRGVYACALFDEEAKLKARQGAFTTATFSAQHDVVTWMVDTLPPGEYAIAVFHDANENGVLDRHAFGYPLEVYGFSNNARGKFGPPAYDKIKFRVDSKPLQFKIQLQ